MADKAPLYAIGEDIDGSFNGGSQTIVVKSTVVQIAGGMHSVKTGQTAISVSSVIESLEPVIVADDPVN